MLESDRYFDVHVVPTFRRYTAAEAALTEAVMGGDASKIDAARDEVMLAAMSAVVPAHHLSDVIATERPCWLPSHVIGVGAVRRWVQTSYCRMLRGRAIDDLDLLGDVANAFKHSQLTHRTKVPRRVISAKATITTATGFGEMHYGEGKFGGAEQVIVQLNAGNRALSSVLQNVVDMWRLALGRPLSPFGQ
jgi:hypothetical protein